MQINDTIGIRLNRQLAGEQNCYENGFLSFDIQVTDKLVPSVGLWSYPIIWLFTKNPKKRNER